MAKIQAWLYTSIGRDPLTKRKARVTICVANMVGEIPMARGIAICSAQDWYRPTYGDNKALGRAVKALKRGKTTEPIRSGRAIQTLFWANTPPFKFKSEFSAKLLPAEERQVQNEPDLVVECV